MMKIAFIKLSTFLTVLIFTFNSQPVQAQVSYLGMETWYHAESLSMAGAGSVVSGIESDRRNPAAMWGSPRQFHLSIIRYPADITAQSLAVVFPSPGGTYTFGLRHLGYGIFEGRDSEGRETENYTSGDTWLSISTSRQLTAQRIIWGITTGVFISQLETYQSVVLTLTPGFVINLPEIKGKAGFSVQNIGKTMKKYTSAEQQIPTVLVGGITKRLAHLPLELAIDAAYRWADKSSWARFGGIFELPANFRFKWGMTTDKFDQAIQTSIIKDFFASTGAGLSYDSQGYRFDLGTYFYGVGGWTVGIGFGIDF